MARNHIELRSSEQPKAGTVTCIDFHRLTGAGALAGFADLHLAAPYRMRLFGCAVFVTDDFRMSVALPTRTILSRDGQQTRDECGKAKYAPVIAFDDQQMLAAFVAAAVAAVTAYASELGRLR
ncbi:hypothetical protein JNB88_23615 [Rhizobium cauense]|uniref:hypothetical protein n=1 Tax=Rhizobium cauense TaxID=1166683 RepID=UPI001C6E0BE6|nr:hypothetical protein [Rhizobium cauense]MBW9116625.1 hypothetical protein [Rhizobium cauense]